MLRRIAAVVIAVLALLCGPATWRALAGQTSADLAAMTNADRAAAGLRALSTANDLQSLAQQRANEMARQGKLAHTTNLGSKVSGWKRLGENVGRGPNLSDIETAFMNSPSHRENILDPDFSQLGVGVTFDGKEYLYVAVIFRQPTNAAPTTTTAKAAPAPAPAPVPRAASAPKPKPTTTTRPPVTTTTEAPTTTTTAPPPPPVETPVEPPAPETTTTTAPRPVYGNRDFLAANFSDRIVPASATSPLPAPGRPVMPIVFAAALGALVGSACLMAATRQGSGQLLSEFSRLRHWR